VVNVCEYASAAVVFATFTGLSDTAVRFVSENDVVGAPAADTPTENVPATAFAVTLCDTSPSRSTVNEAVPVTRRAPDPGGVSVMRPFMTGSPKAEATRTPSGRG
jgi:hypothetical protein